MTARATPSSGTPSELQASPNLLRVLVSRRWWPATILILLGMAGLAQLGFWQLDRLEWRRGMNTQTMARLNAPPVAVNGDTVWEGDWHDRQATARGVFDYRNQIGIKNRFYKEEAGIHLLTPMRLEGSDLILMVDRGWIPQAWVLGDWSQYDEGEGLVEVRGLLQDADPYPSGADIGSSPDRLYHREDLELLGRTLDMEVAPMFLLAQPVEGGAPGWPRRQSKDLHLSEGNHLSYAIQWFLFSLILGVGYVLMVRKRARQSVETVQTD
ncbi:MAG: SURF1 family protein [Caldilineaceae bacterium SB0661_bin_34]|nr:SURF1 family protein [Caldilineaceae bacterium SB0661_bin_34]